MPRGFDALAKLIAKAEHRPPRLTTTCCYPNFDRTLDRLISEIS